MIQTTEQILLMAFRYALPRNTGAPYQVVSELRRRWEELPSWMQKQIQQDIRQASGSHVRDKFDYSLEWDEVLKWDVKEEA